MRDNVFPELPGELRRHTDVGPRLAPVSPIRESLTDLLHRDRTREQPNIGDIGDVSAIPSFEGIVLKPGRADHRSDRDKARNRTPDIKDHTISGTSLCVNSPPTFAKVFLDTSVIFAAVLSSQGGARMVLRLMVGPRSCGNAKRSCAAKLPVLSPTWPSC
jgi:hypothetical protein